MSVSAVCEERERERDGHLCEMTSTLKAPRFSLDHSGASLDLGGDSTSPEPYELPRRALADRLIKWTVQNDPGTWGKY